MRDPAATHLEFASQCEPLRLRAESALEDARTDRTLDPAALIRSVGDGSRSFVPFGARTVRAAIAAHARRRAYAPGSVRVTFSACRLGERDEVVVAPATTWTDALDRLERRDPESARLLELHLLGGAPVPDIAEQLVTSYEDVRSRMRLARAWLVRELA